MMGVIANRFYNDPGMAQAASNIAGLFAPPSGSDMAGYANARQTNDETSRLAQLFQLAQSPDFNQQEFDRMAIANKNYAPVSSYYAVDADSAAKKYSTDTTASTSLANNAADNVRAITTNKADNLAKLYVEGYNNLSPGDVQPAIPTDVLSQFGGTGPAVPELKGTPKPLSETEVKGGQLADLISRTQADGGQKVADELIKQSILGTDVVNTVGPGGSPVVTERFDAAGKTPVVEPKPAAGLDTYVRKDGTTFVGHSDEQGQVFDDKNNLVADAVRKGAPASDTNKIEGVDDYIALGPDNKEQRFVGYFDPTDKKVHDQSTGQPVPNVIQKGIGSQALSIHTNPDGSVDIQQGGSGTGRPTAEQARANYVGIQARPAVKDLITAYDTGKLPTEGDYWRQYSLDNADKMDPGMAKGLLDYANEKFGRTSMSPEGQAYYANMNEVAPLELLIQSGAAVNEGEALRKQNQLRARPSDTPAVTAIRKRGLLNFLKGVDQWASGKIDTVNMPDMEGEIAKAGGDTKDPATEAPGATGSPAAAAPAAAAPAAAPPAQAAPGATPAPAAAAPAAEQMSPEDRAASITNAKAALKSGWARADVEKQLSDAGIVLKPGELD